MKRQILKNISKLPGGLNLLISEFNTSPNLVFGNDYGEYKQRLQNGGFSSKYNEKRLLESINHAIKSVPYYRDRYNGAIIDSIQDFVSLFQYISKDIVVSNFNDFIADDFDFRKYDLTTTGGTSGKPLKLFVPKRRYISELATVHDAWSRVGYQFDMRAVLRNHKLPPSQVFEVNPITKEIYFDNFRLNDTYMFEIYKVLRKHRIPFFHAYPSAAYQFSVFCHNNKLDLSFLKAFLCSSENIYPHQVDFVNEKLGCRLFGFYGHTEKLLFGSFCEHSDTFHMEPSYGYFELIDDKGDAVNTQGGIGEMVGTSLNNWGMPLIRYKTGDYAEYVGDSCPQCGRKMPLLRRILGRWDGDKIYNKDGTYVTTTALNLHSDIYAVINGLQYYQKEKGALQVLIIRGPDFQPQHEFRLLQDLRTKLSSDTAISVCYVERLFYNNNGKFLLLKSDVV